MGEVVQMPPVSTRRVTKPLRFGGKNPKKIFDIGVRWEDMGFDQKALQLYKMALDAGYKSVDLYVRMGSIEALEGTRGSLERAKYFFQIALDMEEDNTLINFHMGEVAELLGEFKSAKEYYLRALEIMPTFYECQFNLARLYQLGSNYFLAIRYWRDYIQCVPSHVLKSLAQDHKKECTLCVLIRGGKQ